MQVVTVEPGGHTRDHSRKIRLLLVSLPDPMAAHIEITMHALRNSGPMLQRTALPVLAIAWQIAWMLTAGDSTELWGAWTGAHHCGGRLEVTTDSGRPFRRAGDGREVERRWEAGLARHTAQHRFQGVSGNALEQG